MNGEFLKNVLVLPANAKFTKGAEYSSKTDHKLTYHDQHETLVQLIFV